MLHSTEAQIFKQVFSLKASDEQQEWPMQAVTPDRHCGRNLFATASAAYSLVSRPIFCSSMTSPGARKAIGHETPYPWEKSKRRLSQIGRIPIDPPRSK